LVGITLVLAVAVGTGALLMATNPAPEVPALAPGTVGDQRPYVIKLHARWCPICMVTKGAWAAMQEAESDKVRFVVFDFTNDATIDASRREAARLGLESVFVEYAGETGTVLVVDPHSKEVKRVLHGHQTAEQYRAAIDETLASRRQ
jgi:hypothetical protein